jgi:hypothetical protein
LEHDGKLLAEVCFQSQGERSIFNFRIPQEQFVNRDITEQLTMADLLSAAAVSIDEVVFWDFLNESHSCMGGTNPELHRILPPPPPGETHLFVSVHLLAPTRTVGGSQEVPLEKWQALDALWKAILGLEASVDALRMSMDGLRVEMENSFRKPLHVDEKVNALQSDVLQWTKAKTRVHYSIPKVREFVHRATWAAAQPERKRLEEIVEKYIVPRIPLSDLDRVRERLEHLQKDRQLLFIQGNAVNQECRALCSDLQRALSTLQRNAVDRARQKRSAGRDKGKHL